MHALALLPLFTSDSDHWGHSWWPIWPILWAAVIGTAVWLILRRRDRRRDPHDPASQILAERFARGELNAEEYRARLDELQRHSKET
jgi:putative membrane protein